MRKPEPAGDTGVAGAQEYGDVWFSGDYPMLWEHLTAEAWDDGTRRQTSTVLLFCEEGRVKACLNDRDGSKSAFVSAESVEAVLGALEAGLVGSTLDWRGKREGGRRGR